MRMTACSFRVLIMSGGDFISVKKKLYRKIRDFRYFRAESTRQLILRDWDYRDLSEATGYSVSYLWKIMSGQNGSRKAIYRISRILGMDTSEFM